MQHTERQGMGEAKWSWVAGDGTPRESEPSLQEGEGTGGFHLLASAS